MLLTFSGVTEHLKLDEPTLLGFLRDGILPPPLFIAGYAVRWDRRVLDQWLFDGCPKCRRPRTADFRSWRVQILCERSIDSWKGQPKETVPDATVEALG